MYVHVLDSLYCQLHWLWYINIVFDSNTACNSILEVYTYVRRYVEFKLCMYVTDVHDIYLCT